MSTNDSRPKSLSPEFLPLPASTPRLTPAQRVAERSASFLRRFRGLGTTAGAAVLSLHCGGYGVVDPLPPPSSTSCSSVPDPFSAIHVKSGSSTLVDGRPAVVLQLYTDSFGPTNFVGFTLGEVRVTGGTFIGVLDQSSPQLGGMTSFLLTLAPESAATAQMLVDVDIGCGSATVTKHYRIQRPPPTFPNDPVVVTEDSGPFDGGPSNVDAARVDGGG